MARIRFLWRVLAAPLLLSAFQAMADAPKPDAQPLIPAWQASWVEAVHTGNCAEAERQLAEGRKLSPPAADASEAVMWRDGLCRSANPARAEALFQDSIAKGHIPAMMGLGWGYLGHGLAADERKARFWYQRTFLLMLTYSKRLLAEGEIWRGVIYQSPNKDGPDWVGEEFMRIFNLSIFGENRRAAIADRIEAGDGFEPDPQAACLWRIDAAKSGSTKAAVALGDQLFQGRGVPARPDRAAYWWDLYGDAPANARLGTLLIDGAEGVPPDPKAALSLLASAKRQGEPVDDAVARLAQRHGLRVDAATSTRDPFRKTTVWGHPHGQDCW
jgi:TPR repeat protein